MLPIAAVDGLPEIRVTPGQWLPPQLVHRWSSPKITSWMESSMPPSLSGLVFAKLGDSAWQRFYDFSRWPDGWAGAQSQSIAWGTYVNFERLLDAVHFATCKPPPSLFLTDEGHLELAWDARDGSTVSVTVTPAGADYFIERRGEESSVSADEIPALAERLCQAA